MNQIKVHLQYLWKFADSSYYKNIIDFLPEWVEFVNHKNDVVKKLSKKG